VADHCAWCVPTSTRTQAPQPLHPHTTHPGACGGSGGRDWASCSQCDNGSSSSSSDNIDDIDNGSDAEERASSAESYGGAGSHGRSAASTPHWRMPESNTHALKESSLILTLLASARHAQPPKRGPLPTLAAAHPSVAHTAGRFGLAAGAHRSTYTSGRLTRAQSASCWGSRWRAPLLALCLTWYPNACTEACRKEQAEACCVQTHKHRGHTHTNTHTHTEAHADSPETHRAAFAAVDPYACPAVFCFPFPN